MLLTVKIQDIKEKEASKGTIFQFILMCLYVDFFTFGGGLASLGVIHKLCVQKYKFINNDDFQKAIIITNTLPGTTIVQIITFIGYSSYKIWGAMLGFILIVFPLPILALIILKIAHAHLSEEVMLKFSKGIMPIIMALLFKFIIDTYFSNKKLSFNWFVYFGLLLSTAVSLLLKINTVIVFSIFIVALTFIDIKE